MSTALWVLVGWVALAFVLSVLWMAACELWERVGRRRRERRRARARREWDRVLGELGSNGSRQPQG